MFSHKEFHTASEFMGLVNQYQAGNSLWGIDYMRRLWQMYGLLSLSRGDDRIKIECPLEGVLTLRRGRPNSECLLWVGGHSSRGEKRACRWVIRVCKEKVTCLLYCTNLPRGLLRFYKKVFYWHASLNENLVHLAQNHHCDYLEFVLNAVGVSSNCFILISETITHIENVSLRRTLKKIIVTNIILIKNY